MIRPAARLALLAPALLTALAAAPLAAQETFNLPPASPTPTPAPAGPADERAGVAIPPRAAPTATPTAAPRIEPRPVIDPLPAPSATSQPPLALPAPRSAPAPAASPTTAPPVAAPGPDTAAAPIPAPAPTGETAPGFTLDPTTPPSAATRTDDTAVTAGLPAWWPFAAGGLGALLLFGGGALLWWRRRKTKPLHLAAPAEEPAAAGAAADTAPPRLDMALEIISASRSLMMFTLEYRLTIANRSGRAVGDLHSAVQLACARGGAAPSPGAAQAQTLAAIDRIGPHQGRSVTGTVRLPLSAVQPLRQGQTPLFVPLVHVTLEGESQPAQKRTFVIGTPSPSGRVHPIPLDVPPGGIAGLVAQAVALPPTAASVAA